MKLYFSTLILPIITLALNIVPTPSQTSITSPTTISQPDSNPALSNTTIVTLSTTIRAPKPTKPPTLDNLHWAIQQKWHITTYYSCATFANGYEHCGWHKPVRTGKGPGGDEFLEGAAGSGKEAGAWRVCLVIGFVVLILLW